MIKSEILIAMEMGRPVSYVLTNEKRPYFSFVTMTKAQGKKDDHSRSIEKQAPGFKCLPGQTESNQKKVNLKHDEIMTQLSFGENCWFSLSLFFYHLKNSFLAFSKLSSSLVLFLKLYSMNFAVAGKVTASCKGPIVCDGQ